ncbi:MAG: hypothetical protein GX181_10080 [Synergistaceae bacterium]|nr:hypothetical protein [Synergistota bacterium]NLM72286.1 hypothetical protein [Synergistaceae bacterium]
MTENSDVESLARRVTSMLGRYMQVQENLFKLSFRKVLPIPGLYRPVDYGENQRILKELQAELLETKSDIRRQTPRDRPVSLEDRFLGVLRRYISQMAEAVEKLADICRSLERRSDGGLYGRREYKIDIADLRELQRKHLDTGVILNELVKELELKGADESPDAP